MDKNGVQVSNAPNSESPPPSSARSAGRKRVAISEDNSDGGGRKNEEKSGGNNGELADHGRNNLWSERERRKKMKNMFTILHHLLPHLPPKVDQYTVVDEAVKHIKTLENTLNNLQKQKAERLQSIIATREAVLAPKLASVYKTWTSPNIALNVCGHDAHINICCSMKPGLLSALCFVLDNYGIDVISIHVASHHNRSMYMIHTRVIGEYACQFPIEEIYKQAAREIVMLCE